MRGKSKKETSGSALIHHIPTLNQLMEQSIGKIITSIAILLGAPILALIHLSLFTGVNGIFAVLFYFMLPKVAIIASALFIGGLDFLKALVSLFKKSNLQQTGRAGHDKKYASSSMLTSTAVH